MNIKRYYQFDGCEAEHRFSEDFLFGAQVLAFVRNHTPSNYWCIHDCVSADNGEYFVTFKACQLSDAPNATLSIRITPTPQSWKITVFKEIM